MEIRVLKILIIEDTPERLKVLKKLYREHAWIHVNSAEHSIKLVKYFQFDLISLDYDLAGQKKGSDIAIEIRDGINRNSKVVVHSMNATGREKIRKIIPDAIIFPLSAMIKTNALFKQLKQELRKGREFDWSGYDSKFGQMY